MQLDLFLAETPNLGDARLRGPLQSATAKIVHKYGLRFIQEKLTSDAPSIKRALKWVETWECDGFDR